MPSAHGEDLASPAGRGWRLECVRPKAWTPRSRATRTSPEHPGTAVRWGGALFEVVSLSRAAERVVYVLEPWVDAHTIRRIEEYSEESEAAGSADRLDQARRASRRRVLLVLAPLAGHLPAAVQEHWEREYDVSAALLTIASAVPLFLYGSMCALFLTILGFTGATFGIPVPWEVLGIYFLVESGVRIAPAWSASHPSGSVLGAAAYGIWLRASGRSGAAAPP